MSANLAFSHSDPLPSVLHGTGIPRTIHQVFHTHDLPQVIRRNVAKIRALNPGWEYKFYDDDDMVEFIRAAYGRRILDYYMRIDPKYGAARADLFRYLLIYKEGGVYLDIKGSLDKPLDHVLHTDDVYLLSRWRNGRGEQYEGWGTHQKLKRIGGHELQQWHIIAAPGHPFLRAVIERVLFNIETYNPIFNDTGKAGVLSLTGPIAYTLAIAPLLAVHPYRLVDAQDEIGLRYSIFDSRTHRAHKSIFKHHYADLQEPVVLLTGTKKFAWAIYRPIYKHLVLRARRLIDAIARRLPYARVYRG